MTSTLTPKALIALPCAADPELFFPPTLAGVHAAQRICAACPLLAECARKVEGLELSGCVVASVWVEEPKDGQQADRAEQELARVAATGKPAAPADSSRAPVNKTHKWNDPEFQKQVVALREAGLSWARLTARLGVAVDTARSAYAAATGAESVGRAVFKPRTAPKRKSAAAADFQKRVVQLRLEEERSWRQIARLLDCAPQTAQIAYERLMAQAVA
ncbi:WhiB family transcriptional regulator [Nocardia tengchongensis]|uniref:WhiB family transcriptional regulator n=1 Tax=Nocardia tengchongensis TaxID=2055889 RepID=UPI0036CD7AA6